MTIKVYSRFTLNKTKRKKYYICKLWIPTKVWMFEYVPHVCRLLFYITHDSHSTCVHFSCVARIEDAWEANYCAPVIFFLPFCRKAAKQLILYVLYGKWKCSRTRIFHVPLAVDRINRNGHGLSLGMHQTSAIGHASNWKLFRLIDMDMAKRFDETHPYIQPLVVDHENAPCLSNLSRIRHKQTGSRQKFKFSKSKILNSVLFAYAGRSIPPHRFMHALNENTIFCFGINRLWRASGSRIDDSMDNSVLIANESVDQKNCQIENSKILLNKSFQRIDVQVVFAQQIMCL